MRILSIMMLGILLISNIANAVSEKEKPKSISWPFDGVFGYFDKQAAQRGFQVYKEVCQVCHSLKHLEYRNLEDIGFSKEEVKAIAAENNVSDGPNEKGEMFERPARPHDKFISPYPNEQAARAANGGAYPPDLSLIINARPSGANYVYSILTGYLSSPPKNFKLTSGMHYNPYFSGRQILMPPPLSDGLITYSDGTEASIDQMAKDVVVFLQWAAEPEMEKRKLMGIKVILYLIGLTILFYFAKRRIWSRVK